jgi:hypothetical protein
LKALLPTPWLNLLALFAVAALIAGHGALLWFWVRHHPLSISVVCGLFLLIVLKHLGLVGAVYGMLARAMKRRAPR